MTLITDRLCLLAAAALVTLASMLPAAHAADGAALYHDYCSVCHGDRGDGNSRARGSFQPPPRDFTGLSPQTFSRERMLASVREGRPGTAMVGWRTRLNTEEIESVVDFIRDKLMRPEELHGSSTHDPQSSGSGSEIYARTCSVCHGDQGKGAVWATTSLTPRPRDFTSVRAQIELGRARMIQSVSVGRADTAMPGFATQLKHSEIESVVDYIRSRFMTAASTGETHASANGTGGHQHDDHADLGMGAPFDGGLRGDPVRGDAIYRINCVACHGKHGDGQGPRAYFILPKPRNFTHSAARATLNRPHLHAAIAKGTVGTEMPAWEKVLSQQDIADVAEYVFHTFVHASGVAVLPAPDHGDEHKHPEGHRQ